jgi:hypothetical protein
VNVQLLINVPPAFNGGSEQFTGRDANFSAGRKAQGYPCTINPLPHSLVRAATFLPPSCECGAMEKPARLFLLNLSSRAGDFSTFGAPHPPKPLPVSPGSPGAGVRCFPVPSVDCCKIVSPRRVDVAEISSVRVRGLKRTRYQKQTDEALRINDRPTVWHG